MLFFLNASGLITQTTLLHYQTFHFTKCYILLLEAELFESSGKGVEMPLLYSLCIQTKYRFHETEFYVLSQDPPKLTQRQCQRSQRLLSTSAFSVLHNINPSSLLPPSAGLTSPLGTPRYSGPAGPAPSPPFTGFHLRPQGVEHNGHPQLHTQAPLALQEHHAGLIYFQHCSCSLHLCRETHITGSHFHDFVAIRISWIRG